jgi:hypothetical protein
MTTNRAAYDFLRSGVAAANLGFSEAQTAADANRFLNLYHRYDDELDALVAAALTNSSASYKVLTKGLNESKKELEDVVDDIQRLVRTTEAALKIATIFAKLLAII